MLNWLRNVVLNDSAWNTFLSQLLSTLNCLLSHLVLLGDQGWGQEWGQGWVQGQGQLLYVNGTTSKLSLTSSKIWPRMYRSMQCLTSSWYLTWSQTGLYIITPLLEHANYVLYIPCLAWLYQWTGFLTPWGLSGGCSGTGAQAGTMVERQEG